MLLPYENQLFLDVNSTNNNPNQLHIFAEGIPIEQVLVNTFKAYAPLATSIVLVLTASPAEEKYYIDHVKEHGRVVSVTTEIAAKHRKDLYLQGGVFFITSRILVVDLLKNVLPADKITGIFVLRAHDVIDSSQEAFVLRLYRSKNKDGFIKAFSDNPSSFLSERSNLSHVMEDNFLTGGSVSLWPRSHSSIEESLTTFTNRDTEESLNVVELDISMSAEMCQIQSSLLDLMKCSLDELMSLAPSFNNTELNMETIFSYCFFDKLVAVCVDPSWNMIDLKPKEILNNLKIFRLLLTQLMKSDCVTFYSLLCNYTTEEAAINSSWLCSKSAENVIVCARNRIFGSDIAYPELFPKWEVVNQILRDAAYKRETIEKSERNKNGRRLERFLARQKTIIFTADIGTGLATRDFICYGKEAAIGKLLRNSENINTELSSDLSTKLIKISQEKRERTRMAGFTDNNKCVSVNERNVTHKASDLQQINPTKLEMGCDDVEFLQSPIFIIPLQHTDESESFGASQSLNALQPDVIILTDPCLKLVRNIEAYVARAARVDKFVKVYFISFKMSVEEKVYLTSIQRERLAFEKLVNDKVLMDRTNIINQNAQGHSIKKDERATTSSVSCENIEMETEQTGQRNTILVDMREFMSDLPSLVHKRGISIEPLTLDVGDYILTPDICVERKTVSDLIGSLNSGRLWKQAEAMTRHYKQPILLIEQHKTQFGSTGYKSRNELAQIMPKLQILTMKFPKLKLLWSSGAHYTSEIFYEMKIGKEQPDSTIAGSILKEAIGKHNIPTYDPVPHEFLSKMPGVDSKNVYKILNRCDSLAQLAKMSKLEITKVMEDSKASTLLYTGLHDNVLISCQMGSKVVSKSLFRSATPTLPSSKFRAGVREKGRRNTSNY